MKIIHDEDEFETVITSRPCTVCNGDRTKCDGGCNGMAGFSQRRRSPAEVKKIKADRQRKRDDEILAQAAVIRARRGE
jgi:hypothetical protein